MTKVEIAWLDVFRKQIETQTNEVLTLRDKFDAVVDEEKAHRLIEALEELKFAIETTPIA
jgi:hypothetical protein